MTLKEAIQKDGHRHLYVKSAFTYGITQYGLREKVLVLIGMPRRVLGVLYYVCERFFHFFLLLLKKIYIYNYDFFFFRGEKRIHLRTLCGTRPKQYPLNSKLPCFLARQWPQNRVSLISRSFSMGANFRTSALYFVAYLNTVRGFSEASYLELPLGTPRNALSPEYDHPGFLLSCGAEVAPRFPWAGLRSVSLLAAPPAAPACIALPAVCRHMAKAEAGVAPIYLCLPADSAEDPPGFNMVRLE